MKPYTNPNATKGGSLLAALGALALLGCTGSLEPNDGNPGLSAQGGSFAQSLFERKIQSELVETCDPGGICHSGTDPAFVSSTNAYSTIQNFKDRLFPNYDPETSPLIVNGTEEGDHKDAVFSDSAIAEIQEWLLEEKNAAASGAAGATELAKFSGCWNFEEFAELNVGGLWANKNANGAGDCVVCHPGGNNGAMYSADNDNMSKMYTQYPAFMAGFFTTNAEGKVVINEDRHRRVGKAGEQSLNNQLHGTYEMDGDAYDALVEFYDKTMIRMQNGDCDPPRFGTGEEL